MNEVERTTALDKVREINKNVPPEMVDELVEWLKDIAPRSDTFLDFVQKGYFYQLTKSPNAKNGGIQVWCNQDRGGLGHTPNHELWRKGDGTFTIEDDLAYG